MVVQGFDKVRSSVTQEAASSHRGESAKVARASVLDASQTPPW